MERWTLMKIKWGEAEKMRPDKTTGMGVYVLQYKKNNFSTHGNKTLTQEKNKQKGQINKTKDTIKTLTLILQYQIQRYPYT